ncbi:DUF7352 domain-containing protein [Rhizobium leguminosarum]|uniref:DUF7352 domain-containing protein n=1 Tax=Rhizobium leguminosarum TaxID=384 RepID=UPI0004820578|nr:hypothetical protein [Rhizobium leguminosarum]
MKVKCIDNKHAGSALTKGRVYAVIEEMRSDYRVLDDNGKKTGWLKYRFETVDEIGWDAATRGPQMATLSGKHILKYQMPVLEQFEMQLPQNSLIIRMEDQGGMFWLWAVVDTRAPLETRSFRAFKTGALIPDSFDGKYVGFCKIHVQMELGLYIFEDVSR